LGLGKQGSGQKKGCTGGEKTGFHFAGKEKPILNQGEGEKAKQPRKKENY